MQVIRLLISGKKENCCWPKCAVVLSHASHPVAPVEGPGITRALESQAGFHTFPSSVDSLLLSFSSAVEVLIAQWCPTLCDPVGCSPPGSSAHGILQKRTLEWFARDSSPGDLPNPGFELGSRAL